MDNLSYYVPNVHFEQIPIKNLVSNQDYQRNLSRAHIAKAAANFDLYQINPVKVSRRNGINYVFNGQHTIEIVAMVSGTRDTPVWCMIYDDLSYEHEADIFANQMKFVKALNPYEIFVANIEAGSDMQLIIRDMVESYGLKVGSKNGPGTICAISTLEEIYRKYGYHTLDHVLQHCIASWEGEANSFSATMLKAVTKLITTYGDKLNDEIFKEKLGTCSVKALNRTAKERRRGFLGMAEVLVIEYNGKKKNSPFRLQINQLYEKENPLLTDSTDSMLNEEATQYNVAADVPIDDSANEEESLALLEKEVYPII